MSSENAPFKANDESSFLVVRALSDALDTQHPSVNVTSRALLVELAEQTKGLEADFHMLASADVNCDELYKYPCVASVIEKTGYTENIFVQILRDLNKIKLSVAQENLGNKPRVASRSLTFDIFDIIELNTAQTADGRYQAPQWAVRLGQWATWFTTTEARIVMGRTARAALSQSDLETFQLTIKLGEYVRFVLHAEGNTAETRVPLLSILAEVADVSVLDMREPKHEAQIAEILKKFNSAAAALQAHGVCKIRMLRASSAEARDAQNDNEALLSDGIVTNSAAS